MAKKKRRYKKKKKATSNLDIAVITLIVLSVLLAVLIYTNSDSSFEDCNSPDEI